MFYFWFYQESGKSVCNISNSELATVNYEFSESCLEYCPRECTTLILDTSNYPIRSPKAEPNEITVNAFFSDLHLSEMYQIPKTNVDKLISDLGGNFGVFLGISLISIFEFFEFILNVIPITISYLRNNK